MPHGRKLTFLVSPLPPANCKRLETKQIECLPTPELGVFAGIGIKPHLLLVRRLRPFHGNLGKRLVKSPKLYVRDSGIVHALLGIPNYNALAGHPVVGASWEGFVIENILSAASAGTNANFYRTSAGAEIDLLLEYPGGQRWAIEIKRGLSPRPEKGFHFAREDLKPEQSFVVYSGKGRYPLMEGSRRLA
jgi:uncharacterized protein